jgi:hypothetical protein
MSNKLIIPPIAIRVINLLWTTTIIIIILYRKIKKLSARTILLPIEFIEMGETKDGMSRKRPGFL